MYTIKWNGDSVSILDQRLLPLEEVYNEYTDYAGVASSITDMEIRGAPAIGIAAAMGIALGSKKINSTDFSDFKNRMFEIINIFSATRPTAVNLFWAIKRMKKLIQNSSRIEELKEKFEEEAIRIYNEDIEINKNIGKNGSKFIEDGDVVMTHCNAGSLATGGYGTALGVIRAAVEEGKKIEVYACETRPYLQGARLTTWELKKDNIPVTLITDNMSGHFIKEGTIKKIIVGADRVAANGDTANKIGTYSHSVIAQANKVPFYIAAPLSTFDRNAKSGDDIPIEERSVEEVAYIKSEQIVPEGIKIRNPAFDVTPAEYITAIITEKGIIESPSEKNILTFLDR
ncbi:S-methyl-5-thioribose-1-phosphate isomerase [Spirochaetota bacterium]